MNNDELKQVAENVKKYLADSPEDLSKKSTEPGTPVDSVENIKLEDIYKG